MPLILNIESATTVCSVALSCNGEILSLRERNEGYSHAEHLTFFCEEVLKEAGRKFSGLDAIAVSKGPGSYTGLRIGVSAAKGFAFALGIPLISVSTLHAMASRLVSEFREIGTNDSIIPMIDARRKEVYCAVYDRQLTEREPVQALILQPESFQKWRAKGTIHLLGDGAGKAMDLLAPGEVHYHPRVLPSAAALVPFAEERYLRKKFEDVAYFEPYYLKDFIAGQKKVHDKI
ncbi:MAG: tRNA (adenosine(37)-N6)-threonylcarbamoyltransferase complex dimerization subunit type 1 TsaB [Bacteroidia bacterium]|nr:tRNA (adenosine(37)-N6)-threonylcarbamoyltransferase complex dimerization subunit type 1 TsaB [Bacteroidia bacterium]